MPLNIFKKALYVFYEQGNSYNTFVRHQRYSQCVLMSNTKGKYNVCLHRNSTETFSFSYHHIKGVHQLNPAVDWISIAQETDQF